MEANFLIGRVNYSRGGGRTLLYKGLRSDAHYEPTHAEGGKQADRLRQRNAPTCHSDTCYRCQLAGGAHILDHTMHHSVCVGGYRTVPAQIKCITQTHSAN
jgi:hypothetical protein